MRTMYRVREKYVAKGWTYIGADSLEEAKELLEDGQGDFMETDLDHVDTEWDTLEEAPPARKPEKKP
jgi:hypothetical protein